jgi:hypothetical protein
MRQDVIDIQGERDAMAPSTLVRLLHEDLFAQRLPPLASVPAALIEVPPAVFRVHLMGGAPGRGRQH